jgi:hypothetical protein
MRAGQASACAIGGAHVRRAELGDDGTVRVLHQPMHGRLRVDQDLDALFGHGEQADGLDQLQPLVHHGG